MHRASRVPRPLARAKAIRGRGDTRRVFREELGRIWGWEDHHKRLVARMTFALAATVVVDAIGTVLIWVFECNVKGGDIHNIGDALFFTTVQILTVSSQIKNPLTAAGRSVDIFLELWAIGVVTAVAGSFSSFFNNADSG